MAYRWINECNKIDMNILFSCAGRRNYLIKYFNDLKQEYDIFTLATDMQLSAPALSDVDEAILVPSIYSEDYIPILIAICEDKGIDMIISLNDLELPLLSENRTKIEATGAKLIVSSQEVIDICFDKKRTSDFLFSVGLRSPKTYTSLVKAKEAIKAGSLKFPLVVKPRWGSASIGIHFPEDEKELEMSFYLEKLKLSRTILATASEQDIDHAILIQEKIEGKEYGLDVINDFTGVNRTVIVKEKLGMRAGETDKAITRDNSTLRSIGQVIGEKLKHIGNLDCDVMESDGNYYVLELNPRFGGGYPFSQEAGANIPKAYIQWLLKEEADISCFKVEFNKAFSKCERLIDIPT